MHSSLVPVLLAPNYRPTLQVEFLSGTALPSWITFSRTSLATLFDSTGKLTYAPNNLLLQSQTFQTTWSKDAGTVITPDAVAAPDGTLTADKIDCPGLVYNAISQPSGTLPTNTLCLGSIYLRGDASVNINFTLGNGSGVVQIVCALTTSWQRFYFVKSTSAGTNITFSLETNGRGGNPNLGATTVYAWGAQLEAVTYQTTPSTYVATTTAAYYGPRFDYDPATLAPKGLLIEEARTNLFAQSQNIATTWAAADSTPTVSGTSLDGTANAGLITEVATTAIHGITQTPTLAATTTYTISAYAKKGTRQRFLFRESSTTGAASTFDLNSGTVVADEAGGVGTISAISGGWYRCAMTWTTTTLGAKIMQVLLLQDAGSGWASASYAGDITKYLSVFGLQLEAGSFPTSYIPTAASAVARSADVVKALSLNYLAPYSIAAEYVQNGTVAATDIFNTQTSLANGVGVQISAATSQVFVRESSVTTATINAGDTVTQGVISRVIGGYAVNNTNVAASGVATGTIDTSVAPPTLTQLNIGPVTYGFGGGYLNGYLRKLALYSTRLPDAVLKTKSVVGAPL